MDAPTERLRFNKGKYPKIEEDMEDTKTLELQMIKKGTEDSKEPWVEITTMERMFKYACTLNEDDREKLFEEFKGFMFYMIAVKKLAELQSEGEEVDLKFKSFKWRND